MRLTPEIAKKKYQEQLANITDVDKTNRQAAEQNLLNLIAASTSPQGDIDLEDLAVIVNEATKDAADRCAAILVTKLSYEAYRQLIGHLLKIEGTKQENSQLRGNEFVIKLFNEKNKSLTALFFKEHLEKFVVELIQLVKDNKEISPTIFTPFLERYIQYFITENRFPKFLQEDCQQIAQAGFKDSLRKMGSHLFLRFINGQIAQYYQKNYQGDRSDLAPRIDKAIKEVLFNPLIKLSNSLGSELNSTNNDNEWKEWRTAALVITQKYKESLESFLHAIPSLKTEENKSEELSSNKFLNLSSKNNSSSAVTPLPKTSVSYNNPNSNGTASTIITTLLGGFTSLISRLRTDTAPPVEQRPLHSSMRDSPSQPNPMQSAAPLSTLHQSLNTKLKTGGSTSSVFHTTDTSILNNLITSAKGSKDSALLKKIRHYIALKKLDTTHLFDTTIQEHENTVNSYELLKIACVIDPDATIKYLETKMNAHSSKAKSIENVINNFRYNAIKDAIESYVDPKDIYLQKLEKISGRVTSKPSPSSFKQQP